MSLPLPALAAYCLLLAVPALVFYRLGIPKTRELVIAFVRMAVQLALVGLYLGRIFEYDSLLLNGGWLLLMLVVACGSILRQSGLRIRPFFLPTLAAFTASQLLAVASLLIVIEPATLFSARYFIPLSGMILGNILRSNIVALERFYSALAAEQDTVIHALMCGATRLEAVRPFLKPAIQGALAPHIAVVATMGLVSLPGMMTGQILGGALPEDAVAYQVMIMVAIVVTAALSTVLALLASLPRAFDHRQRLRDGLFPGK